MAKKKITCKYKFGEDYNPLYCNGAQGGITTKGEIVVNFYLERHALPRHQVYEITDGQITGEIQEGSTPSDLKESFIRFIQTGVIFDYSTAKSVHTWLGNHIETLESIEKETKDI
jgi:hypothetical protein